MLNKKFETLNNYLKHSFKALILFSEKTKGIKNLLYYLTFFI